MIACDEVPRDDGDGDAHAGHGEHVQRGHAVEQQQTAANRQVKDRNEHEHEAERRQHQHEHDGRDDLREEDLDRPRRADEQLLDRPALLLAHEVGRRQQQRHHRAHVQQLQQAGKPRAQHVRIELDAQAFVERRPGRRASGRAARAPLEHVDRVRRRDRRDVGDRDGRRHRQGAVGQHLDVRLTCAVDRRAGNPAG